MDDSRLMGGRHRGGSLHHDRNRTRSFDRRFFHQDLAQCRAFDKLGGDEMLLLILADFELEMFEETRRESPDIAREFINSYMKERLKAARRVFNDPDEVEQIVDLLEAAERKSR